MQTQFPTPQGLLSSTFEQPPLDGSLLLPEIFDHHAQRSPNHPLFHYVDADGVVGTIVWLQAVQGFHNAAHIIRRYVNVESPERRPVVGVVASSDQITYFSVIAGILRAGYQAFPVSPRNSDVGISHLLQSTDCTHVFVSPDSATQKLVAAAAAKLSGLGKEINILPIPTFEDLFASDSPEFMPPMRKIGLDAPAVILHSSGSTAFPKTITFTYRILMESGLIPYYGRIDLCGHVLSAHAVPMFHLMGVIQLPWTTFCGLTISVLPPTSPPIVPTPDRVFDGAIATKSSLLFCVPAFLESWAREPHRLAALKSFRTVIFGGGPLQPAVGDMLVQHGVHIAHVYGLTETSNLTWFLPESAPKEGWDYFYLSPHTDPVFVPLEDIPGVYHLVIKKSPIHTPAMLDTVVDGVPGLNTNDLFVQHPTNPNLWKVYGRHDDQIMHSTGEKTNPGPLEAILLKNPRIKHAVMFGRGKFHAGVLVFPAEPIDPADAQQVIEFRRQIWSTVEEANQLAPTHSRLFKEMILVADPSRPIELTAKGTPRRQAVLNIYQDEIRDMYGAVEESSQTHLTAPEEYDFPATLQFMRHVVSEVMLEMPGDDDDIFQHGCDSLQATWIRNSIFHAFRKSQRVDMKTIPSNFVYSYPTLRLLADLFTQLASGSGSKPENVSLRADAMQAMAHKYTQGFPAHRASAEKPEDEVLLVTGTTGALGSHLIAHLLDLPEVSMVYALNRPSSKSTKSIQERQRSSFVANGIDVHLLESPKLKLFEANLSLPRLGLSNEDHGSLRATVTSIVHNAWQVNFNISLSTLEPLVAGTRHLVDFALSSPHPLPPRFIFISTAGIFRNSTGTVAPEEHVAGPKIAVGLGYTESKWVAEEILETAAQRTALSPVVIRPGQLSGAANGAWNASDWFPALLKSSQLLGHLPALSGRASWFPIHHAARVVAHLRTSSDHYLHITHPQPIPTSDITSALSHALGLPLVPYAEWLESLEAASLQESAAASNPGVRLLDFFRAYREVGPKQDMFSPAGLANERATRAAGWMLDVAPLAASDVDAWVSHLRQVRYLD